MIQFAQPWALLALLAIPVLIALHALRPRRRQLHVSTNEIWREALREQQQGLGLQKLLRDLSLLLLLLFALAAALALADPRWQTTASQGRDTVLVIDVSASMQTRESLLGGSRLDAARQRAQDIIDTLGDDSRLLLMTSGRRAVLRTGFETDREVLSQALREIGPGEESGRPETALELALSLIRNRDQARVILISDAAFDESLSLGSTRLELIQVGGEADNVAITRFDYRPEIGAGDRSQVLLTVRNYTARDMEVPLEVTLDDQVLVQQSVTLAADSRRTLVMPVNGAIAGRAHARIDVEDDLAPDNHAWAVIGADERIDLLLYSEGNYYLESLLAALPNVRVTHHREFAPEQFATLRFGHDIVVFDRVTPPALPEGRYVLIDALPQGLPWRADTSIRTPRLAGVGRSALVSDLELGALRIDRASKAVLAPSPVGVQRLMWSEASELALALLRDNLRIVYLAFDLHDSNFPLLTAFPLFVGDALQWLRPRQTRHTPTQFAAGETLPLVLPADQADLVVRTPSGEGLVYAVEDGKVMFDATSRAGIYRYERALTARYFAVNLTDERESDVSPRARIETPPLDTAERGGGQVTIELWPWLAWLALLLLAAEWVLWCWRPKRA